MKLRKPLLEHGHFLRRPRLAGLFRKSAAALLPLALCGCMGSGTHTYVPSDLTTAAHSAIAIFPTGTVLKPTPTAKNKSGDGLINGVIVANTVTFDFSGGLPTPFEVGNGRQITYTFDASKNIATKCYYPGAAPAVPATGIPAPYACPGAPVTLALGGIDPQSVYVALNPAPQGSMVTLSIVNTNPSPVPYANLAVYVGANATNFTLSQFDAGLTTGVAVPLIVSPSGFFSNGATVVTVPFPPSASPSAYDGIDYDINGQHFAEASLGMSEIPIPFWALPALAIVLALGIAFTVRHGVRQRTA